jgi:phosphatidylglycerol:prolipoprotein diacylglycerol transferase
MSGNKPAKQSLSSRLTAVQQRLGLAAYWYVIILVALTLGGLYINHLITGETPDRTAVTIFGLPVYWYGILIIFGVGLGTYVVSQLALEKALRIFKAEVPEALQAQPVTGLKFSAEIQKTLDKYKVERLGQLLFQWGLHPERIGLNRTKMREVQKKLETVPAIAETWLTDAPWRIWNPDYIWSGITVILVVAIIGARLYHVFTPSPSMEAVGIYSWMDYFRQPLELINIRNGGLGIYGGIVGGALGLWWYCRRNRIPTIALADLGVIGVALGQFVGRWGNFFNQELFGKPTSLPWAVHIDSIYRPTGFEAFETFHPAFLYESLWNFMSFLVMLYLLRRYRDKLQTGDLVAVYLIGYGIGRILLEFVRLDSRMVDLGFASLPVATLVSLVIALPMAALLIKRHLLNKE